MPSNHPLIPPRTVPRSGSPAVLDTSSRPSPPFPPAASAGGAGVSPAPHLPFEQAATVILGSLQHALLDTFAASPSEIRKAGDVEHAFGINHLLGWQLYRIAHAQNPLAAGMHVPARVSMKKFLTAAARRRIPAETLRRVSDTFDAFEQLVETDAGDRDELDAMLGAFLPEERRKQDLAARQALFKASSQLRGVAAEADVAAMFFHLSEDGSVVDRVTLNGQLGMRRTRPEAHIIIGSGDSSANLPFPLLTLDGRPASGPWGALLPQFSTSPLPEVETHELGGMSFYRVAGQDVGLRSAIDLVIADRRHGALPRYLAPGKPRFGGPSYAVEQPVKRSTLDVFVHRDVFPGIAPRLWVYDTTARGPVTTFEDPTRAFDLIDTHDAIRTLPPLTAGLAGARLPHAPRYVEMLEHVYRSAGWDPAEFRGYRLDVQFPMPGTVYMLGFELPKPPAE